MSTPAIATLDRLDVLDRELAAIRSAPLPLDQVLAAVKRRVEADARLFQARPWSQEAGLRGALSALCTKPTLAFEEGRAREAWASDPRPPLDDATRQQRILAVEGELQTVLAGLDQADLVALEQTRDHAHAVLRGLTQRRDEVTGRVDRRVAALAMLEVERQAEPGSQPEPPENWPGRDANGEPQFTPAPPPRPLSRAERRGRDAAITAQLVTENVALDRLAGELAAIEAEVQQASRSWRAAATLAERCKKWLQKKPAVAVMPAAAE